MLHKQIQSLCQIQDHQDEPIIGVCLSLTCNHKSTFCYNCRKQFHFEHQNDCKTFKNLSKQIPQIQQFNLEYKQQLEQQISKFSNKINQIILKIDDSISKLDQFDKLLKKGSYIPNQSDIDFLKNQYHISEKKQEQSLIDKLNSQLDSLQQLDLWVFKQNNQQSIIEESENEQDLQVQDQNIVDVMIQQGMDLYNTNEFQRSLEIFEQVLKIEPTCSEALNWKIEYLMKNEQYEIVLEVCDSVLKQDPQRFEIYLKKGEALLQLHQNNLAVENIFKGIFMNPQKTLSLVQQNLEIFGQENHQKKMVFESVLQQVQQMLLENPNKDWNLFQNLNLVNFEQWLKFDQTEQQNPIVIPVQQDTQEQQHQQTNIIESQSNKLKTIFNYFLQLYQSEYNNQNIFDNSQIDQSEQQQNQQNNGKDDSQISVYIEQGDKLIKEQNYEQAIKFFDKILQLDLNNWIAHKNKAQCLNFLNQNEEAIQFSNQAIKIDPESFSPYLIKGSSQIKLCLFEEAIESLNYVIMIDNTQHKAYALKGEALHHLKRYKEAIIQFDIALFIYYDAAYLIQKADTLFELKKYQEAKTIYNDALLAGSKNGDYINKKLKSIQSN